MMATCFVARWDGPQIFYCWLDVCFKWPWQIVRGAVCAFDWGLGAQQLPKDHHPKLAMDKAYIGRLCTIVRPHATSV